MDGIPEFTGDGLLRSAPPIRRARDFHLYTQNGRRLVDLWQDNGRAVLGHTPPRVLRELKNTANRGLFAPLPSPWEGRLIKALGSLFPNRAFRLYAGASGLREALAAAGRLSAGPFPDPALESLPPSGGNPAETQAVLWRPFLGKSPWGALGQPPPLLVPRLPMPFPVQALVLDPSLEAQFPRSALFPPVLLAAALRGLRNLLALPLEQRALPFPRINRALSQSIWRRRGVYLYAPVLSGGGAYAPWWNYFLQEGFLLPPHPQQPLIIPRILSAGEEAKLAALLGGGMETPPAGGAGKSAIQTAGL